jgi:hypothetical protein
VCHASSQHICGFSVLIPRNRDGTLRNITSKRCPMRRLGSGDSLPGSLFCRYSSDANGRLLLPLYVALAMRGCGQSRTRGNGLTFPWLCRPRTIWRAVVWWSTDYGLRNQESGLSETGDLRINDCKHFLSIHAHEHTKSRLFKVVRSRQAGRLRLASSAWDISAQHIVD